MMWQSCNMQLHRPEDIQEYIAELAHSMRASKRTASFCWKQIQQLGNALLEAELPEQYDMAAYIEMIRVEAWHEIVELIGAFDGDDYSSEYDRMVATIEEIISADDRARFLGQGA